MYYYFSSRFPAVIKVDGAYLGQIDTGVKTLENKNNETPFIEVIELSSPSKVYAFLLNKDFLCSTKHTVAVTDLKGGYFIKFLTPTIEEFSVIGQEKFSSLVATVFNENGLKLSVETPADFYYENLDFCVNQVKFFPLPIFKKEFLGVEFLGDKKTLAIYLIEDKIKKVFFSEVNDYSFDNGFFTKICMADIAKHQVEIYWDFKDGQMIEKEKVVVTDKDFCISNLNKDILPYAFLEDLLVGGDVKEYLTLNMQDNADKLKGYMGNFIGVCPPPTFRNEKEIGLIYSVEKNVYKVDYFIFELDDRKICNIKKVD